MGSSLAKSFLSPLLLQAEVDDDLFADLLGSFSKPFEIQQKRSYDYILLDDGIEGALHDLSKELKSLLEAGSSVEEGSAGLDVDLRTLNRPLVVQLKGSGSTHPSVVEMLTKLQDQLKAEGRSLALYPVHVGLSSVGAILARDLRSALLMTGIVSKNGIDPEVTECFCKAARELFEVQLKTQVRLVGASVRRAGAGHEGFHTGSIDLEGGSVSVSAMLTISGPALPTLMKRMTGLEEVPEDVIRNCPSEFANILGGAARSKLNAAGYSLRSPAIPRGYGPDGQQLLGAGDSSTALEVRLETELGEAFLEVRFFS